MISSGFRQTHAAGGFSGLLWIANSRYGSSNVAADGGVVVAGVGAGKRIAVCGGDVIVKPPTRSTSGMCRSTY